MPKRFCLSSPPWRVFALMVLASLFPYFHQVGLATIGDELLQGLGQDASALGLLGTAFALPYGAMQIPAGLLTDRFGPKRCMVLALLLAGLGTVGFSMAHSLQTALVTRALTGLTVGVIFVPAMKFLALWFPSQQFARVVAIFFTVGAVGNWLGTTPMAYATALMGWRAAFLTVGLLTLATCAIIALRTRDTLPGETHTSLASSPAHTRHIVAALLRNKQGWLLGLWYFCTGGIYFSFIGVWGGQYLKHVLGFDITTIGWILSPAACAIAMSPVFILLADKLRNRGLVLAGLAAATGLLALPMLIGVTTSSPLIAALHFFLLSTATMGGAALVFAAAKEVFPPAMMGSATGFINLFPFLGAAFFYQGAGAICRIAGLEPERETLFTITFALYVLAGPVGTLLALRVRQHHEEPRAC